jgi:hypothetical protein
MPLLWLSLAFLFGIMLADLLVMHWVLWAAFALVFLLFVFLEKGIRPKLHWQAPLHHFNWQTFILLFATLFTGAARFQAQIPIFQTHDLAYYNGAELELMGVIDATMAAEPDPGQETILLRVDVIEVYPAGRHGAVQVNGTLLVRLSADQNWQYGDRVLLSGRLTSLAEEETFASRTYFSIHGVYSMMYFPAARLLQRGTGNPHIL